VVVAAFITGLFVTVPTVFMSEKQVFLPEIDDGRISARLVADSGISLNEMDRIVARLEGLFLSQPEVETAFSQIGGFVFGRSQYQRSNRGWIRVQLVPGDQRKVSSTDFVKRMKKAVRELELVGVRVRMRNDGIRGIRLSSGDDDVSIRVQGNDLNQLARIGDRLVERLGEVEGLSNLQHSAEDIVQELSVVVDRERASALGLDIEAVSRAVRIALQGIVVTDYLEGDRQFDVRLRLPAAQMSSPRDVESILLFPAADDRPPVYLGEVADVKLVDSPADIRRDRQQRIIEVSASITGGATLGEVSARVAELIREFEMPEGYTVYDGGAAETLAAGNQLAGGLLGLAVFLVLVVMAVQYESLRNPLIILLSIPFAVIGVGIGIVVMQMPISMPIWLGLIMLTGIVVNNAIVLVEYVEIARERGHQRLAAVVEAGRLRLRPILMTTLTTVFGMMPLAIGFGEGSEMLRPLAVTIVSGLAFSVLVSLLLVPTMYMFFGWRDAPERSLGPSTDDPSPALQSPGLRANA
jgi:multidrug efflux pump subunit AcrB